MRILFLAPLGAAFGEALQGVRLATKLAERGHEIVFLASASLAPLLDPTPFLYGRIDRSMTKLDRAVSAQIRRLRCDALVLVDAAAVGKTVRACRLDPKAFLEPEVPVVGLDCWNLPGTPVAFDYYPLREEIDPGFFTLQHRLTPVPIAPLGGASGYAAMPRVAHASAADRTGVRAGLGLPEAAKLILWPTARWQHAASHDAESLARRAALLPHLVLPVFDRLGADTHILHVGPVPMDAAPALASRYHFIGQVGQARFEQLVAAADMLASFNAAATSLATAVAAGTPVVLAMSESRASTLSELSSVRGLQSNSSLSQQLAAALPLVPLRAWPLSLDAVLGPTIEGNPFYDLMVRADPFESDAFLGACRRVLFDTAAADAVRHRQAAYGTRVASLPPGDELLLSMLE